LQGDRGAALILIVIATIGRLVWARDGTPVKDKTDSADCVGNATFPPCRFWSLYGERRGGANPHYKSSAKGKKTKPENAPM